MVQGLDIFRLDDTGRVEAIWALNDLDGALTRNREPLGRLSLARSCDSTTWDTWSGTPGRREHNRLGYPTGYLTRPAQDGVSAGISG